MSKPTPIRTQCKHNIGPCPTVIKIVGRPGTGSLPSTIGLGVKRVTEPNRTEPTDYTGQRLRKFPIIAVPGFTAVANAMCFVPI